MGAKTEDVIDAVRRVIERWVITKTDLIANAMAGDAEISVRSTRRFNIGERFLIHNDEEDMENMLTITAIPDQTTIQFEPALKWNWPMVRGAHVVKTQNDLLVKQVVFGDPDTIKDIPAITVSESK